MSNQQRRVSQACSDKEVTESSQLSERHLNDALVIADLGRGIEEYLEIVDRFYSDEIVLTSEATRPPVRGKEALRSFVTFSIMPLHIFARIGGMRTVIRVQPIPGDNLNETHAAWTIDLIGVSGKTYTLKWHTQRIWQGSRVVHEHHYDEQEIGEPLTLEDLKNPSAPGNAA